eukprot:s111_g26.t1
MRSDCFLISASNPAASGDVAIFFTVFCPPSLHFPATGISYFWPPRGHLGRSGWIYKPSEPSLSHRGEQIRKTRCSSAPQLPRHRGQLL